jgi:Rrf2 family nitric oxide-sensitive transcriptional repressor
MFSQTAEYALRTIVWLAGQGGAAQTTQQIAEATKVPRGYLSKILQSLGRAGLVRSQRGLHGGFTLTVDPGKLSPLDVIDAIDPIRRIEHCPLGLASHHDGLCPLHRRLDDAIAQVRSVLGKARISELLGEPNRSGPLCD